jgi:hypothetical protein
MRSKAAIIAFNIYNNYRMKMRSDSGNAESDHGVFHYNVPLTTSLNYIEHSYRMFLRWSGIPAEEFAGKTILEAGAGDNLGVALSFLAAGAKRVVSIDKFYSRRDPEQQREIYLALRERLDSANRQRFDNAIDLSRGITINEQVLRYVYGTGVEEADKLFDSESFDFVISKGALQDVYDLDAAFAAMDRLLVPGGRMIHKADLSDQGMFSSNGFHPLTFLTIVDSVYKLMSVYSGKANRKLIGYYREKMKELGYDSTFLITRIVGEPNELIPHKAEIKPGVDYSKTTLALIDAIRPRLTNRYRNLPDEELLASGIFLVARKPERGQATLPDLRVDDVDFQETTNKSTMLSPGVKHAS